MNQREKFLAICIGVIGVLFLGRYFWNSAQDAIDSKDRELTRLKGKLEDQDLSILSGQKSQKRILAVTPRAAAKEEERARADYEKWLIQLTNDAKLENPKYGFVSTSRGKDKFITHGFTVEGRGDLANITRLLYLFYTKPLLHRINDLNIKPAGNKPEDAGRFQVALKCEYLAIPTSKEIPLSIPYDKSQLAESLAEYDAKILNRNLFSLPNTPPELTADAKVSAHQGSPVDYTVTAKEPDPNQKVTYSLEGDAPEGLKVDPQSGKITWTGQELGEYKLTVRATDSGLPSKSTTQLITIQVVPPLPPAIEPEKFNIASQAKLTGLVSGQQGAEAWIHSLTEGKTLKLRKDDQLSLGDLKGTVLNVGANYIEIDTDGRKWTLGIDETVLDAYKRGLED